MSSSLLNVQQDQQSLASLAGLVEVYGQVAAGNLKVVKQDIIGSREFMTGLQNMFQEIKSAWEKRAIASTILPNNNLDVAVFVSANLGFYGDIVERIYAQFEKFVREKRPQQLVVLGREGRRMVKTRMKNANFIYLDFPDDRVEETTLKELINHLKAFERVNIFHGKYVSTITQDVVATTLLGSPVEVIDYIFEPNPDSIVKLFEGEILSSVIEQALREGQLSKFGARIMHLGEAMSKIETKAKQLSLWRRRILQDQYNKKQRTRLVSVKLLKSLS